MTIWFTADTHFFHYAIIEYCNRPVPQYLNRQEQVFEMNKRLVENWNEVVKDEDEVYHLGDFGFCGTANAMSIFKQLKGKKYLIRGNHDHDLAKKLPWIWAKDYYNLRVHDSYEKDNGETQQFHRHIVLCHYPILSWDGMAHGSWHLHGHCHGSLYDSGVRRIDVGVDCNQYKPVSYEELKNKMALREVKPVDHHGVTK